MVNTRNS
jgi:hypothetical protein